MGVSVMARHEQGKTDSWIPVGQSLPERWLPHFPEQSERILIARRYHRQPEMAFYRFNREGFFHPTYSMLELCGVTHWRLLPPMPKGNDDAGKQDH